MPSSFGGLGGQVAGVGSISGLGIGKAPSSLTARVNVKPQRWILYGVTKDYLGVALGGVTVEAIEAVNGIPNPAFARTGGVEPKGRLVNMSVSNTTTGAYKVDVNSRPGTLYQVDAYLTGSPDRAGTTVNTLQANLDTDFY
jgi:hypothetical protein